MLWRGIGRRPRKALRALVGRGLRHRGNAEVAQQHFLVAPQEHIFWLDVAVNEPLIVGILQPIGHLLDIGQNGARRQRHAATMAGAQRAIGGIVHYQIGDAALYAKVQHLDNVRMAQARDGLRLGQKVIEII